MVPPLVEALLILAKLLHVGKPEICGSPGKVEILRHASTPQHDFLMGNMDAGWINEWSEPTERIHRIYGGYLCSIWSKTTCVPEDDATEDQR